MMNRIFKGALFGILLGASLVQTVNAQAQIGTLQVSSTTQAGANGTIAIPSAAFADTLSLSFSPDSLQNLSSSSSEQSVELKVTGGSAIIYAVGEDSGNFTVQENTCKPGTTLNPATIASCTFKVKFTPLLPGARYAELFIKSDATVNNKPAVHLYGNAALTLPQTISISAPGSVTYGTASFQASATSSVGLTGIAINSSGNCAGTGTDSATITVSGAGTCTVSATHTGNTTYSTATATPVTVTIAKVTPTISVAAPTSYTFAQGGQFAATPSSASPVSIIASSRDTAKCTVAGTTVTMVATGSCVLDFNQAANNNYNAASTSWTVALSNLTAQTITFGAAPTVNVGTAGTVSATASSQLGVTFSSTTPSTCTISGSTVTGVAAGTCTIAADQGGNGTYSAAPQVTQSFTIGAAPPVNASCDTSTSREAVNSQIRTVGAGQTMAYSFTMTQSGAAQVQYPSGTVSMSVSAVPCDFSAAVPAKCKGSGDVAPRLNYTSWDTRMCILPLGGTYYFNIKMTDGSAGSFMVF